MTTIYHNPRCTKSRQTLQLLEEKGEDIRIIKYLEVVPSQKELSELLQLLQMTPIDLIRKGEKVWKEHYKGKQLTDAQVIKAMIAHPKLIERPIVVKNGKAVLGRPPENILNLL